MNTAEDEESIRDLTMIMRRTPEEKERAPEPSGAATGSVMDAEAELMRAAVDFSYQWGIDQKQHTKIYWLELHITKLKTLTTAALKYAATVESQNH